MWDNSKKIARGLSGGDHTTGIASGHYMYVTSTASANDTGILLTKPFNAVATDKMCQVRGNLDIGIGAWCKPDVST